MASSIEELAKIVASHVPSDGSHPTAVPGLFLTRWRSTKVPRQTGRLASLCVVAQGRKRHMFDEKTVVYDASQYFLSTLSIPGVSQVVGATPRRPLLCVTLLLDFVELNALIAETGVTRQGSTLRSAFVAVKQDDEILDALIRLVRLLANPHQIAVLAPLIRREIFYRLLLSEQGGLLRQMTVSNQTAQRLTKAFEWLKSHTDRVITVQEVAHEMGMSPSAMNRWFRLVTSMTPIQFHKCLRLQSARSVMLSESIDAIRASQRVGYASPSHFSRDYYKFFGASPLRDIKQIRILQIRSLAGAADVPPGVDVP